MAVRHLNLANTRILYKDYPGKCYNDITSEHISIVMSIFFLYGLSTNHRFSLFVWNGSSLQFMCENTVCPLILQAPVSSDGTVNRIVRFFLNWIE